ncbi:MAG: tetratricopeptide repeat protein, partial [Chloroflexota bacterium]|nr:tetratricopeptide repeat protein [Chloroflexota bacterium]
LEIADALGQPLDRSIPLYVLGRIALSVGDRAMARRYFDETLAVWRATGDTRSAPWALAGLATVAVEEGNRGEACDFLRQAFALSAQLGSLMGLVYALEAAAMWAAAMQRFESAVCLAGAAAGVRAALEHPISTPERAQIERWLESARASLGPTATEDALTRGNAWSVDVAVDHVRTLGCADRWRS